MPLIIFMTFFWATPRFFKSRVTMKLIVQSKSIVRMERSIKIMNCAN